VVYVKESVTFKSFELSWQAGESNGGSQVTQYIVSYNKKGSSVV